MKIKVEIDENIESDEIIIRTRELNADVLRIQSLVNDTLKEQNRIVFYHGEVRYYLPLKEILFFETDGDHVSAHTIADIYQIKHRLYELEELLPGYFMRGSKSMILNLRRILSIDRNLASSSLVSFQDTHKKVYVSRRYVKPLTDRLEKRGINDE